MKDFQPAHGTGSPDRRRPWRPRTADATGVAADRDKPTWWCTTGWFRPRSWRWCPPTSGGSMSASCRNPQAAARGDQCTAGQPGARRAEGHPPEGWRSADLRTRQVKRPKPCRAAGVKVCYVPGITAAQGAAASHRCAADPSRTCHRRALCHRASRPRCGTRSRLGLAGLRARPRWWSTWELPTSPRSPCN